MKNLAKVILKVLVAVICFVLASEQLVFPTFKAIANGPDVSIIRAGLLGIFLVMTFWIAFYVADLLSSSLRVASLWSGIFLAVQSAILCVLMSPLSPYPTWSSSHPWKFAFGLFGGIFLGYVLSCLILIIYCQVEAEHTRKSQEANTDGN